MIVINSLSIEKSFVTDRLQIIFQLVKSNASKDVTKFLRDNKGFLGT